MAGISDNFKFRRYSVVVFFFVLGVLLAGRLFFIQVVNHDFYLVSAEKQYNSLVSKSSVSVRGDIYFTEKDGNFVSAAAVKRGFLIALNPMEVTDSGLICGEVTEIVQVDKDDCLMRADKENDPFEVIAHKVGEAEAEKIKELALPGLNVYPEEWRFYPGGSLASQCLGFVGYQGNDLVGRYGLEQSYEDVLVGKKDQLAGVVPFAVSFFELGKNLLGSNVSTGHDIVLTIEPQVQTFLETALIGVMDKWKAESAGGIIMDPKTGAIIAMASKPDFDPNFYNQVEDLSYFKNPLTSSIFEVGSVMKPLTLAAAMDQGKITPQTTYKDNGYVIFDNQKIENYDGKGRGVVDMQTVLNQSLNTGAVFVMRQLGKENFLSYFKNYGFSEKTGIDLPDEVLGRLNNLFDMRDVEYATASFGQGIAISPVEFISAVSSLANNGKIMKPYVVQKIIIDGGKDVVTVPSVERRVLKEETAHEMTRMLVKVVDEALLDGTVKMEHYSIAAKTGTAQLVNAGGEYYDDQYLHSFFGYSPAFGARFLIFLYLKKPQGVRYASQTLTEPFMGLMKFLLNYYQVSPDR